MSDAPGGDASVRETGGARGIVVAHGAMAEGLIDAVRRIAGAPAEALQPLSNEGQGPQQLKEKLEAMAGGEPTLVFADLSSGSCAMAALVSCKESPTRAVVCGVNLPILLDFVFHRDLPLDELVPRLLAKGRDGISALPHAG